MLLRQTTISLLTMLRNLGNTVPGNLSKLSNCPSRIVWMDMEMSGLEIENDQIMEVACLITDSNLNIIADGPELVLHQPDTILNNMNEWCTKQHQKTGLTEASRNSSVTLKEAEDTILNFIAKHVVENSSPLAGNSVYMDRMFLRKYMPRVDNFLHYRIIDVSTIKELCRMWDPEIYRKSPPKQFQHRALNDIKESVAELKYYKHNFFRVNCVV